MSITRDPIFKSVMFALAVIYIGLVSQSVWAAKGGKPDPGPVVAEDVDCVGCVGTGDIADGAVTENELSADFLEIIVQLNDRIDTLEARPSSPTAVDGNGNNIGQLLDAGYRNNSGGSPNYYVTVFTEKGYLVEVNGTLGMQHSKDVYFTGNNCTGDAYIRFYDGIAPGWVIQAGLKTNATVDPNRAIRAYYVPLDAEHIDTPPYASSRLREGLCSNQTSGVAAYRAFPNDPAITGMQNELYTLPIRPVK